MGLNLGIFGFYSIIKIIVIRQVSKLPYFDYGKNPKNPKLSPMPGSKWRRVWYLWFISVHNGDSYGACVLERKRGFMINIKELSICTTDESRTVE